MVLVHFYVKAIVNNHDIHIMLNFIRTVLAIYSINVLHVKLVIINYFQKHWSTSIS